MSITRPTRPARADPGSTTLIVSLPSTPESEPILRTGHGKRTHRPAAVAPLESLESNQEDRFGPRRRRLRLPVLRGRADALVGPVPGLRRLEHPGRGAGQPAARRAEAEPRDEAGGPGLRGPGGRDARAAADRHRRGGVRPRLRR